MFQHFDLFNGLRIVNIVILLIRGTATMFYISWKEDIVLTK